MTKSFLVALVAITTTTTALLAQSPSDLPSYGARTVAYRARDLVAVRTKVRFTTLISLPDGEDIIEATCGDKEFWIVNVRGAMAYVKPAKPSATTNLNLLTTSGHIYAFLLSEISENKSSDPDLALYLETDEATGGAGAEPFPRRKYVPADQVDDFRAQAEIAREDLRRGIEAARSQLENGLTAFRISYPLSLQFPYRVKLDRSPFFVKAIFHDERNTYIQASPRELPSLYEIKDFAPNLVNFEVQNGIYIVPKVLDSGYLAIGKKRLVFMRVDAR